MTDVLVDRDSPEQEWRYREAARRQQVEMAREEHHDRSYKDYGKSFRSRPGSADWRARCSCGWEGKVWYYGKSAARAGWDRHLTKVMREAWEGESG